MDRQAAGSVGSWRDNAKSGRTSRLGLAYIVRDERLDLAPQANGGRNVDRVERTQAGSANGAGDAGEVHVQLHERQQGEERMGVGDGVGAPYGLGHLDDGDPARNEASATHDILEGGRLALVDDQFGQR